MRFVRYFLIMAALLTVAAASAPTVGQAAAAGGGLRFVECLSGSRPERGEPQGPRAGGCKLTRTATPEGEGSGLDHLSGLTASPDASSLYAVSVRDDSLVAFTASPLRMTQCFTTDADLRGRGKRPCQLLPGSGTEGVDGSLDEVHFVAVSPDGRDVYAVSADGSIATFARAPSGRLSFAGFFSGLGGSRSLAISPDGRFVYVALGAEAGIATLARAADGSLQFVSCLRGAPPRADPAGLTSRCPLVAPTTNNPNASGLRYPSRIVISADGTSLYATSAEASSIAEFGVDPASGALTFSGCLAAANRGTGPGDPCRYVPQATADGAGTSMYEMGEIAIAPGGTGLYGVSTFDNAVVAFARDPATGKLTFASCIDAEGSHSREFGHRDPCSSVPSTDKVGNGSGLYEPRGLAISPNGRNLFVGSHGDATIDRFLLTPAGGLHIAGCVTDGTGRATRCTPTQARNGNPQQFGFDGFNSLAATTHTLLAAAGDSSSLSRFAFP